MPVSWNLEIPHAPSARVLFADKMSGYLDGGTEETVTIGFDASDWDVGSYKLPVIFKQERDERFKGSITVDVIPPSFIAPQFDSLVQNGARALKAAWSYADGETEKFVRGYDVYITDDNWDSFNTYTVAGSDVTSLNIPIPKRADDGSGNGGITYAVKIATYSDFEGNPPASGELSRYVPFTAGLSNLPDTGITKCINGFSPSKFITCPLPGERYYGQDAQYSSNPLSYSDNGNGTVTDNITGLMWQQADDGEERNWDDAKAYCEGLTLAGHSDWRLPNRHELFQLVDKGRYHPAIDPVFSCRLANYWSSSLSPGASFDVFGVEGVKFVVGTTSVNYTYDTNNYVRCVRPGP